MRVPHRVPFCRAPRSFSYKRPPTTPRIRAACLRPRGCVGQGRGWRLRPICTAARCCSCRRSAGRRCFGGRTCECAGGDGCCRLAARWHGGAETHDGGCGCVTGVARRSKGAAALRSARGARCMKKPWAKGGRPSLPPHLATRSRRCCSHGTLSGCAGVSRRMAGAGAARSFGYVENSACQVGLRIAPPVHAAERTTRQGHGSTPPQRDRRTVRCPCLAHIC